MIVFIVFYSNFHGDQEFNGVFSCEETAQAYINRFDSYAQSSMVIEEHVLDSM